jgi:hypothetical protein
MFVERRTRMLAMASTVCPAPLDPIMSSVPTLPAATATRADAPRSAADPAAPAPVAGAADPAARSRPRVRRLVVFTGQLS